MQRRNKNIRKACDEIENILLDLIYDFNIPLDSFSLMKIKRLTHRIKRTTWRGEKKLSNSTYNGIKWIATQINTSTSSQHSTDY